MTLIELAPTAADFPLPAAAAYAASGGARHTVRTIPIAAAAGLGVAVAGDRRVEPITPVRTMRLGSAAPVALQDDPTSPCPALADSAFVAPELRVADVIRVYDEDDWFHEGRVRTLTATDVTVDFRHWWAVWRVDALRWEVVECGCEAWVAPGYSAMLQHGETELAELASATVGIVF